MKQTKEERGAQKMRWYYANREHQLRGDRARHARVRAGIKGHIDAYLAERACVDCGEADPIVLDFDHVGEKSFGIASAAQNLVTLEALKAEIAKCEIRCANCHRRKTHRTHGHRDKARGLVASRFDPA